MKIKSIELSRGIAALIVVLFHTTGIMGLDKYYAQKPVFDFWSFGHAGVDFFFVLSGFIIHYTQYNSSKSLRYAM
jgi:exopolysaccharide production protein ExoZ